MVMHEVGNGGARTVSVDVYLNYDDEATPGDEDVEYLCEVTDACSRSTSCDGDATEVKV